MDSTAQPTPRDSYIINELLSRVTHGYDSPNRPYGLRYHIRTAGTGDALIRQPKQPQGLIYHQWQPLRTQISSTNCCHGGRIDSTAQTAPRDSEIINETIPTGDAWIRQPKQPLGTQKSSTKLLPRVTHGFDTANRPRN
jgi:hypothetical protein